MTRLLVDRLHNTAIVSVQNPLRLINSEPQPDLAILCLEADKQPAAVPGSAEVLLVIEVADTPASYDRTIKVPLYASNEIPEVWLINLPEQVIEVYRGAAPGHYQQLQTLSGTDTIAP